MKNTVFNDVGRKLLSSARLGLVVAAAATLFGCESGGGKQIEPVVFDSKIRGVHAVVDAPAVDITIGENTYSPASGLAFGLSIPHIGRQGQSVSFSVDARLLDGTTTNVVPRTTIGLEPAMLQDVFVIGTLDDSDDFDIDTYVVTRSEAMDASMARVTVAHLAPGVDMVDVYVTSATADLATATAVGTASYESNLDPVELAAGDYRVRLTEAGTTNVVYDRVVTLEAGRDWVLAAIPNPTITADSAAEQSPVMILGVNQDFSFAFISDTDGANLRVVHGAPNTGGVDVLAKSTSAAETDPSATLVTNLTYPNFTSYVNIDEDEYTVSVNATGTTTAAITETLGVSNGAAFTAIALNTIEDEMLSNNAELLLLADATRKVGTYAQLRLTHAAGQAGNVDIYIVEEAATVDLTTEKAFEGVAYKASTGYVDYAAGTYDVVLAKTVVVQEAVEATETTPAVPEVKEVQEALRATITLENGEIYSAIARDGAMAGDVALILMDQFTVEM